MLIFIISILTTYLPQKKIKLWMKRRGISGYFFASFFGAITPFCSCSSIPLFIGFLKAGVPLGVTFAFLITSPIINEYLVVLMIGFFGWKITLLYIASGLIIGVTSGIVLGKLKLEQYIVDDIRTDSADENGKIYETFASRLKFGIDEAISIVRKIWIWILVGIGIGAIIHNYVPDEIIQTILGRSSFLSVPIATLLGVPIYGSCAAIIPIALVLFQKGVPLGSALAFMIAIAALSLPEAIILRRTMKLKLITIFFSITTFAIILTGYIFNFLQPFLT